MKSMPALSALVVAMVAYVFAPVESGAEPLPILPGQWEVVSRPDFGVGTMSPPPLTVIQCLTPDAIKNGQIKLTSMPTCSVTGGKWQGEELSLTLDCGNSLPANANTGGLLRGSGATFAGSIQIQLPKQDSGSNGFLTLSYQQSGRRTAEKCNE